MDAALEHSDLLLPVDGGVLDVDDVGARDLAADVEDRQAARSWDGAPRICEPRKCTDLVWADPAAWPADALDFLPQAWDDAQNGQVLREYGFNPVLA